MLKTCRYGIEGFGFWLICRMFQNLSLQKATDFGGWFARTLGPHFPIHHIVKKNLMMVFPSFSSEENETIAIRMWDHWGRVSAEYCHIPYILSAENLLLIEGEETVNMLRTDRKPAILFSGHLGNFQMITLAAARLGLPLVQFYRHANNPFVDRGMRRFQTQATKSVLTKGEHGTLHMLRALKDKEHVFVLADQKFSAGVSLPFLGHGAYTSTAIAKLCRHFSCPLVPVRSERLEKHFKITFYPPLDFHNRDDAEIMTEVNHLIGNWIIERPEQWFWMHKRWPFSV